VLTRGDFEERFAFLADFHVENSIIVGWKPLDRYVILQHDVGQSLVVIVQVPDELAAVKEAQNGRVTLEALELDDAAPAILVLYETFQQHEPTTNQKPA